MKEKAYQICNNCVMDTTDSKISFDDIIDIEFEFLIVFQKIEDDF